MQQECTYFKVFFEETDRIYVDKFVVCLETSLCKWLCQFNFIQSQKYNFIICPTIEEYILNTGKTKENYQDWMVGYSDFNKKLVCILSPNVCAACSNSKLLKVAEHELVHMLFDDNLGLVSNAAWLSEENAILLSNQTDSSYIRLTIFRKLKCFLRCVIMEKRRTVLRITVGMITQVYMSINL